MSSSILARADLFRVCLYMASPEKSKEEASSLKAYFLVSFEKVPKYKPFFYFFSQNSLARSKFYVSAISGLGCTLSVRQSLKKKASYKIHVFLIYFRAKLIFVFVLFL